MKKILIGYITKNIDSGIDQYIINFANSIKNEDVQIDFLSRENKDDEEKIKKVILSKVKYNNLFFVSTNKKPHLAIKDVKRIIEKEEYDIAYFNISDAHDCLGLIAAKQCKVEKIIVHSHSSSVSSTNPLKRVLIKITNKIGKLVLCNTANTFLACSKNAAKWLFPSYIYNSSNYIIIYNAIDVDRFIYNENIRNKMRKKFNSTNNLLIGHIGRFDISSKNNYFVIDIFRELLKIKPNAKLICVGGGDDFDKVRQYAERCGVLDDVVFTGRVNNVEECLQAIDVFILPSKFEGLPISGIEAQFSDIPCLFSDRITDEVIIGKQSKMLPINSPKEWAKEITLFEDKRNNELLPVSKNFDKKQSSQSKEIISDKIVDVSKEANIYYLSFVIKFLLLVHYICNLTSYLNGFNYLTAIIGVLIIFVILSNIKNLKRLYGNKLYVLLFTFMISYTLSISFNHIYNLSTTIKGFIWMIVNMFFVNSFMYFTDAKQLKSELKNIICIFLVTLCIFNLINLYQLITVKTGIIISFGGEAIVTGISSWGRFYGVFYDPNYSSVMCSIAFVGGCYLFSTNKNKFFKLLSVFSNILVIVYICFCQSRSGLLTFALSVVVYLIIRFVICKEHKIVKLLTIVATMTLFTIFVPSFFIKTYNTFILANKIENHNNVENTSNNIGNNNNNSSQPKENNDIIDVQETDTSTKIDRKDNKEDISNRRFDIWKSGFELFQKKPIIGIGYGNVVDYALNNLPKTYIVNNNLSNFSVFHNFIIDVCVNQGLVGLIIVIIIIIKTIYNIIKSKILISKKDNNEVSFIISSLFAIGFSGMFLSHIFYVNNAVTFLFWLIFGYLNFYIVRCNNEE